MNLHQNKDDFIAILNASQAYFKIPLPALEKDYYVTLFLIRKFELTIKLMKKLKNKFNLIFY